MPWNVFGVSRAFRCRRDMQSRIVPEDFKTKAFTPGMAKEKGRQSSAFSPKTALRLGSRQVGVRSPGARAPQAGVQSPGSSVRRRSSSYTSSDNDDLRTDSESVIWRPGQAPTAKSVLRENQRLRHVLAESELQLARLTAQVATLQQREFDRTKWNGSEQNVEKVWDPNDPVYGLPPHLDKDQSATMIYQERARAAEERLRAITQQQEITEETLHLHRRRVSKLYTKIDRLHRELQSSRDQAHRMELTLKACEETDRAQKEKIQELEEKLSLEREAHENLHQRFRAALEQDGKWRDRLAELSELLRGRVQAQEMPSWMWQSPPRAQETTGKPGGLEQSPAWHDRNGTPSRQRAWEAASVNGQGREPHSSSTAFSWNNLNSANSGPRTPTPANPSVRWTGRGSAPDPKGRSEFHSDHGGGTAVKEHASTNLRTSVSAATHKISGSAAGIEFALSNAGQEAAAASSLHQRTAAWTPMGGGGGRSMAMHTSELDVLGGAESIYHGTPTLNLGGSPDMSSKHSRAVQEPGSAQKASGARHGGADDELTWILRRFEVEQDSFRREMDSLKSLLDLRT